MSTADNKVHSHRDELTEQKLSDFENTWIDARVGEIEKFTQDENDYREGLFELIMIEDLEFDEIKALLKALWIEFFSANISHLVSLLRDAAKEILCFNPDTSECSLEKSLQRIRHVTAIRETLLEAYACKIDAFDKMNQWR